MDFFLNKVADDINLKNKNLSSACFILPNKRSAKYFKQIVLKKIKTPAFVPLICSIDFFIVEMSGLSEARHSKQILFLYECYLSVKKNNKQESFEEFMSWATVFLNDISELDQNLADTVKTLKELDEINKISNWGKTASNPKENLSFWKFLPKLYELFKTELLKNELGTKGLCYREAKENLEHYKDANKDLQHFFIGLNSLSKSEELIIKELIAFNKGEIYWDIDNYFLKNKNHGSSLFIRKYKNNWERYIKHPFKFDGNDYQRKKKITILETPKVFGQAKIVGGILGSINHSSLEKTVVVLGDESIVDPVLNYIPKKLTDLNITIHSKNHIKEIRFLISKIFDAQLGQNYVLDDLYKQLSLSIFFKKSFSALNKLCPKESKVFSQILKKWDNPFLALKVLINFFNLIRGSFQNNTNEFVQINSCLKALTGLEDEILQFSFTKDYNNLKAIILSHIEENTPSLKADLNAKVQIMGLLETRALDFKNIIITSLNEGILPKGKTQASLIPYDLRKKHNLLTFDERDAIYTYHFYRLIKRAENIFLIFNNFNEGVFGGEKSRFIHQIEIEDIHNIVAKTYNPTINIENINEEILKTPATVLRLKEFAKKGFSPSSLSNYIKEPEEFYYKNLLNLHDNEEKEEISPRLIGIVFHESLESLYKPFIKKVILKKDLLATLNNINYYVQKSFKKNSIDFKKGKGLIAFEVVKKAIDTLIRIEIKDIERGNKIEILALEKKMECEIDLKTIKSPVKLKGIIDRLDRRNGVVRIIDYKTGLIKPNEVVVKNLEDCFNKTNLKSMQLLCYVLMYFKNSSKVLKSEAAIISLRDLNKGLINFGVKESSTKTDYIIDKDKIKIFEKKINELVLEIMDPNIPFVKNS